MGCERLHARVSTARQGRDQAIDSQLDDLRGWAAGHSYELNCEHVYIDEGCSGSRLDRPALDRLRDATREGEFDAVGVYTPDRLARRYAYQVVLLEDLERPAAPSSSSTGRSPTTRTTSSCSRSRVPSPPIPGSPLHGGAG